MDNTGPLAAAMRRVREQLATLTGAPPEAQCAASVALAVADDRELCALTVAIEEAGRLVDALRVIAAGEVEKRSGFERGTEGLAFRYGHRRGCQLVEQLTRISPAEAAQRVKIGTAIRPRESLAGEPLAAPHPLVADGVASGDIAVGAAAAIIRCLDQAVESATPSAESLAAAEAALVQAARSCTADEVGVQARAWREALDPDGAEPRDERIHRKRVFRLGRETNGLTPFSGVLAPVDAALLTAAFAEADKTGNTPRFLSDVDRAAGTTLVTDESGETVVKLVDRRTRGQRHYDVVVGLLTAGVRSTGAEPNGMRSKAQVCAIITLGDLRARTGVGWIDGIAEPVSAATVNELVCASGFAPILLGDAGEVLMLGREQRLFSPAQMKAMRVRDGGCINCGAPPGQCEGHHVLEWQADEGKTDIDNGVLLCSACHHMFHLNDFALRMIGGRPHVLAPPWLDPEQKWRRLGNHRLELIEALKGRIA